MRVLGISGSLRRDSFNSGLLRAAAGVLPPGVELEVFDGLKAIPPYDADDDVQPAPAAVQHLRDALAGVDAVLVATPEYNASIPGVLKNALDWASRPHAQHLGDRARIPRPPRARALAPAPRRRLPVGLVRRGVGRLRPVERADP